MDALAPLESVPVGEPEGVRDREAVGEFDALGVALGDALGVTLADRHCDTLPVAVGVFVPDVDAVALRDGVCVPVFGALPVWLGVARADASVHVGLAVRVAVREGVGVAEFDGVGVPEQLGVFVGVGVGVGCAVRDPVGDGDELRDGVTEIDVLGETVRCGVVSGARVSACVAAADGDCVALSFGVTLGVCVFVPDDVGLSVGVGVNESEGLLVGVTERVFGGDGVPDADSDGSAPVDSDGVGDAVSDGARDSVPLGVAEGVTVDDCVPDTVGDGVAVSHDVGVTDEESVPVPVGDAVVVAVIEAEAFSLSEAVGDADGERVARAVSDTEIVLDPLAVGVTVGVIDDDGDVDGVHVGVAVSVSVVVGVPELGAVREAVAPGRNDLVIDALNVLVIVELSVTDVVPVPDAVAVPVAVPVGVGVGGGVREGVRVCDRLSLAEMLVVGDGVDVHEHANGVPPAGTAKVLHAVVVGAEEVVACGLPKPSSFAAKYSVGDADIVGVTEGVFVLDGVREDEHVQPTSAPDAAASTCITSNSSVNAHVIRSLIV